MVRSSASSAVAWGGVALLPQKLSGAQEGTGGFLPAHHGTPLVVNPGQIPVGVDVLGVEITEQRLRGGAHAHALLQGLQAAVGHPGHLGGESLHVVLLLLQQALRDKQGHVHVLHARGLEPAVQLILDVLPDRVARGFDHHAALHAGVVAQLGLFHHIRIPLGEIHVHGCDGFHHFLVVCHDFNLLLK